MSSASLSRVHGLQDLLDRCQRRIRVYAMLRGTAETVSVAIGGLLLSMLIDYFVILPSYARVVLLLATLAATIFVAIKRLIMPVTSSAPRDELGAAMDLKFPELQESLATLISFDDPGVSSSETGSALMRERLTSYVQKQIGTIVPARVVENRSAVNRCGIATASIILLLTPILLWPSGSQLLFQRFFMPLANLATPTDLFFEVPNGDRVVSIGSDVDLIAIPQWHSGKRGLLPQEVVVEILASNGSQDRLPMAFDEEKSEFQTVLPDAQDSFKYRIRGDRAVTKWFQIAVATPPSITKAELIETPPVYTGRPVESFDGIVGDIHVFERSQIEVRLSFNKPVDTVDLLWKNWKPLDVEASETKPITDAETAQMDAEDLARATEPPAAAATEAPLLKAEFNPDRTSCVYRFEATGSGAFEFLVSDSLGLRNPPDPSRRLLTSGDKPPKLVVKGVRDELEVRPDDVVALNCTVTDDVGVGLLELHYQKNADAVRIEPFAELERGSRSVTQEFSVAMKTLAVADGDTVTFRVRAADERPVPGPQVVWKGPWTIRIKSDAEPLGKKPLREDDQKLVDALRKMEEELQKDVQKSNELKNELWKNWDEPTQQQVKDLSEKEQTQGRELQKLAEQVAEHPLMAKQAEKLTELAQQIREEVPSKLTEAASSDRDPAAQNLQKAANDLNKAREELHKITDEIQKIAEVEQELAELNRLALEAQQLARESEKLDQERQSGKPEEGQTEEERQQQLDERQAELQTEQQDLSSDLNSLLQRRNELLQAAREAQLDEAAEVARRTRELAQQQQQLAEGVREEAHDTARDAQELANQLQQARNEADQLGHQMAQQDQDMKRPEMQPLDEAIREIRQGNLESPKEKIDQVQETLQQSAEAVKNAQEAPAADPANPPDPAAAREAERKLAEQNQKRAELGAKVEDSVKKLEEIQQKLENMQTQLAGKKSNNSGEKPQDAAKAEEPSDPSGQDPSAQSPSQKGQQSEQPKGNVEGANPNAERTQPSPDDQDDRRKKAGAELLEQLKDRVESANELAETMKTDKDSHDAARRQSQLAAERADEALRHARAGQFKRSAERMRDVANESSHAAEHLQTESQQDRRSQLQQQRDDFNRMSDLLRQLDENDSAQVAAQQEAQEEVAESAQEMADPLRELSERMNNEALGMQQQSKPLEEAAAASEQAAQMGEQASDQLDQAQMQQAGQSAQEAANQLNRAAQIAEQASQGHRDPNNVLPSEVGESVNDAMQSLRKANELMNQQAADRAAQMAAQQGQQGEPGQPGQEGQQPGQSPQDGQQPGEGQPGNEQAPEGQPNEGGQPSEGQPSDGQSKSSGQQGQNSQQGQPGQDGKPGQGKPGQKGSNPGSQAARQMAKAAKALQQAARQVVPGQFSPGQLNPDEGDSDSQANGNSEQFDGRNPNATTKKMQKKWGTLHDELEEDSTDYSRDKIDPEYAEFVRRFRSKMATSAQDSRRGKQE
jgi:hypothetical protein